ncbi:MAG: 50S ribosomal protein L32 [Calditerrivibrio sp.]|nr:50S ribosomal protein L32 [Calditerrivibrio sp.]MCA1980988.1 50S ribosomal protein L32 [Calditerrivibrio sp.]
MPNPKGKSSRSKIGARRSHHRAIPQGYAKCDNCNELKLSHAVCPNCGYYAKKQVLEVKEI